VRKPRCIGVSQAAVESREQPYRSRLSMGAPFPPSLFCLRQDDRVSHFLRFGQRHARLPAGFQRLPALLGAGLQLRRQLSGRFQTRRLSRAELPRMRFGLTQQILKSRVRQQLFNSSIFISSRSCLGLGVPCSTSLPLPSAVAAIAVRPPAFDLSPPRPLQVPGLYGLKLRDLPVERGLVHLPQVPDPVCCEDECR